MLMQCLHTASNTSIMTTLDYKARISYTELPDRLVMINDMSGFEEADFQPFLDLVEAGVKDKYQSHAGRICTIGNFTEAKSSPKIMKMLDNYSKRTKSYLALQTVIGVTGFKRALLKMHNSVTKSNVQAFDDEREAFDFIKGAEL